MHQTRAQVSKKVPIPRKGTKYVARQRSHLMESISVVAAVRDILHLARTAKEVKKMIHAKQLQINGKDVKDYRDSIKLFGKFHADKDYHLVVNESRRFNLEEDKSKNRPCKLINKTILKGKKIQLNFHDGANVLSSEKVNVGDTVYLSNAGKVTKVVALAKGSKCMAMRGRYMGAHGKVESVEDNKASVNIDGTVTKLEKRILIAL